MSDATNDSKCEAVYLMEDQAYLIQCEKEKGHSGKHTFSWDKMEESQLD